MWLTSSSIGRKTVMALTGAFLVLFVTFHVLMNGVALFWPTAYNTVCEFLGANWYALLGSAVLALGFLLHILFALWLTWQNRRARGSNRYAVTSRPKQVEWASKNMLVLGIVVICFLAVHMYQFWAKMQLVEVLHLPSDYPPAAGTLFIQEAFSCPWTLIIYLIGFIALWFHLTHGIWSMCHTIGWNNGIWMNRLKTIGNIWATFIVLLFVAEAVVFTVNSKKNNYLNCPALQEQYLEMAAEGEDYPMLQSFAPEAAISCDACPNAAAEEAVAPAEAATSCDACPNAATEEAVAPAVEETQVSETLQQII